MQYFVVNWCLCCFQCLVIEFRPAIDNHLRVYLKLQPSQNTKITQSLTTSRINHLTSQILIKSLSDLPSRAADLPPELHSIIEIVTAQLSGHIPDSDRAILSNDIDDLFTNINTISDALSAQLSVTADYLCKIADPTRPPAISDLPSSAAALQARATLDIPHDLQDAHLQLTHTLTTLLTTHLTLLTTTLRILERTQHGALARHTRSTAELLHTRSTLLGLQAQIHTLAHPPPVEFLAALKSYRAQQGGVEKALRDREALARRELDLYGQAGERGMRDLAGRKGVLEREIEKVEGEIGRIEGGR